MELKFKTTDNKFQAVLEAFCLSKGYPIMIDNPDFDLTKEVNDENPDRIANTESMEDFMLRKVTEYIHEPYMAIETDFAAKTARESKRDEIKDVNVLTKK